MANLPDPAEWITRHKIPVGRWVEQGFDWLLTHAGTGIDGLAAGAGRALDLLESALRSPHPFVIVALAMGLTWLLRRRIGVVLGVGAALLFILNQGYWRETMQSLALVISACILCMGVGVPLGIAAAHRPRLYAWMRPVLDLMQTLPSFVYLVPAVMFFGLGTVAGLFATVVFVLPAPIRLTHLGIRETPRPLIEAATAFGASPRQLLWKVELPSAVPQILAGLNQTIMLSLSMIVIAALVGAAGLGVPVQRGLSSMNIALGFEAGLVIVVLAVLLDRMLPAGRK